jgi:hypothetical protein
MAGEGERERLRTSLAFSWWNQAAFPERKREKRRAYKGDDMASD